MRMHKWTPEMIRFMREAAEYGDYYQQLAQYILPCLHPQDHICDAGCGLGHLSMALSGHVRRITALDRNPDAIRELRAELPRREIHNIDPVCADIRDFRAEAPFDAMIFCLFGDMTEICRSAMRLCRDRVILIRRRTQDALFPKSYGPKADARISAPHVRTEMTIPLNQPFRDIAHARAFLTVYPADYDIAHMTDDRLRAMLTPIRHPEYRYALPVNRNLEMIVLKAEDLCNEM